VKTKIWDFKAGKEKFQDSFSSRSLKVTVLTVLLEIDLFREFRKFSRMLLTVWLGEQSDLLWTMALCLHIIQNQAKTLTSYH
jgi:hypothetical protein